MHIRMGRIAVLIVMAASSSALGQAWTNTTGSWGDSTKWSPNGVPDSYSASVTFGQNNGYFVNVLAVYKVGTFTKTNYNAIVEIKNGGELLFGPGGTMNTRGTTHVYTNGRITFSNGGAITNTDTITSLYAGFELRGGASDSLISSGAPTTIGAKVGIYGNGKIWGNWINNGSIAVNAFDVPQRIEFVAGSQLTNNDELRAEYDGVISFQNSTITQGTNGYMHAGDADIEFNGCSLSGGRLQGYLPFATNNAIYVIGTNNWSNVIMNGRAKLKSGALLNINSAGFVHQGNESAPTAPITINDDGSSASTTLSLNAGGTVSGIGTFILNAPMGTPGAATVKANNLPATFASTRTLQGTGTIAGSWTNNGVFAPGLSAGAIGLFEVSGPLTLGSTSVINADVLGPLGGQFDKISSSSSIALNGALNVKTTGWSPTEFCSSVTLLSASSVSGKFASYTLDTSAPPSGKVWRLEYSPTGVTLRLTCPADLSGDCFVLDNDFTEFASSYDILDCADPAMPQYCPADLNNDSVVDDTDFSLFAVAYDALNCSE